MRGLCDEFSTGGREVGFGEFPVNFPQSAYEAMFSFCKTLE
jgi:hypothetical protein